MKLRISLFSILFAAFLVSSAADPDEYMPQINGTVRTRWEMLTDDGLHRFQVRNARLSVSGKIAPFADYFMQADMCDRGKIKALDYWGRLTLAPRFQFRMGQFRQPFGVDAFRGPHQYLFANRSYMAKQMCNMRGVGAELSYTLPSLPLNFKASAFNPEGIGDHEVWHRAMSFAGKATLTLRNVTFSPGIMSMVPDSIRINLLDFSTSWKSGGWIVEGEYMHKHYTDGRTNGCHGYLLFASYAHPMSNSIFNRWSLQGRFDGMTAHSNGKRDADGLLKTTDPARNRITVGGTLSYIKGSRFVDLRLNYEKMFFHHDVTAPAGEGDKVVAEMVLRF